MHYAYVILLSIDSKMTTMGRRIILLIVGVLVAVICIFLGYEYVADHRVDANVVNVGLVRLNFMASDLFWSTDPRSAGSETFMVP